MRLWLCFLSLFVMGTSMAQQTSNDHIFPAAEKAKQFINFDNKGFLINGQRTFLVSAGMEYARVPRALWQDRLLRLKRAGFNCIEIYTFWNFHEPQDGQFDFTGDRDLNAFLQLVHQMGMYVIARVGPYYCAEWDFGGYPLWLRFKPGLRVREHNTIFEKYTGRFFEHLFPIISSNQINHGGAVILVQLENEHIEGWGTYMPNEYFHFLKEKALSLGMEVPYFFSGLHHGSDPAEDRHCDDSTRPNPWMSTEFWSVWFTGYGSTVKDARVYEKRTWKIIANGGNGYNYYMAHGGSNFDYFNNDEDAASYDYGAAVGQTGDLRPIYYSFKRIASFARSFQDILENSTDATLNYKDLVSDTSFRITARKSPSGEIIFLENKSDSFLSADLNLPDYFKSGAKIRLNLNPGETFPIVRNFKLAEDITLDWSFARILGISRQSNSTKIVVYGKPDENTSMNFNISTAGAKNNLTQLKIKFSSNDQPQIYTINAGAQVIRVLAVNETIADRTWFLENDHKNMIVTGPAYLSDIHNENKEISINTEQPWMDTSHHSIWLYTGNNELQLTPVSIAAAEKRNSLSLSPWKKSDATDKAKSDYDDSGWKPSDDPLQMGADGDLTADAWYRTDINIQEPGHYTLQLQGGGRATGFVDGKMSSSANIKDGEMVFDLKNGKHKLAIFTAHDGRDKLAGYIGFVDEVDAKGLYGKTLLVKGDASNHDIANWKYLKANSKEDVQAGPPSPSAKEWKDYTIGQDVFDLKKGFAWFAAIADDLPAGVTQMELGFKSVDENATVFINGKQVAHHEGWNTPFKVFIDRADTLQKPVRLSVFIENYSNEGGIDKPVRISFIKPGSTLITGWRMKGGVGGLDNLGNWKSANDTVDNQGPCFYRSTFVFSKNKNSTAIYRVAIKGLGHGSIWVNGYNLGRYPEKIDINSLYIPECWLRQGENVLTIYDEDGKNPQAVSVDAEKAASRDIQTFTHRNPSLPLN